MQGILESALPPVWMGTAPQAPGAAVGIGSVQEGIVSGGVVTA